MKRYVLVVLLLALCYQMLAQESGCGTHTGRSAWLKDFQQRLYEGNLSHAEKHPNALDIPITLHVLRDDQGQGHLSQDQILESFCQINQDFQNAAISFYIKGNIIHHDSSRIYAHSEIADGALFMLSHNLPNSLNVYIVDQAAGWCGYNLPYAGIMIAKSCFGGGKRTLTHEIGHALGLPHTFLGWEGNTYHYQDTTPLVVTLDQTIFKDSMLLDTTIIDTILVETYNRQGAFANCQSAADGFCDTYPDYISSSWACDPGTGMGMIQQKDRFGNAFWSDGTYFMSYAYADCKSRFSGQQILAMKNFVNTKRQSWIQGLPADSMQVVGSPSLTMPANGSSTTYPIFSWVPVQNASTYYYQVALLPSFGNSTIVHEGLTSDTSFYCSAQLSTNNIYYWRVKAFNSTSFCAPYSNVNSFTFSVNTNTFNHQTSQGIQLVNSMVYGENQILLKSNLVGEADIELFDLSGKKVASIQKALAVGEQIITIPSMQAQRVYFLRVNIGAEIYSFKLFKGA